MDSSVSGKDEIWFLRMCHHVPHELYSHASYERKKAVFKDGGQNIEGKQKCIFQLSLPRAVYVIECYDDAPAFNMTEYTLGNLRALL